MRLFLLFLLSVFQDASSFSIRSFVRDSSRIGAQTSQDSEAPSFVLDDFEKRQQQHSPLSLTYDELIEVVGGKGRANIVWDCYRAGIDPLDGHHDQYLDSECFHPFQVPEQTATEPPYATVPMKDESKEPVLGRKTARKLHAYFGGTLDSKIARVVDRSVSADGTTKLLIELLGGRKDVDNKIDEQSDISANHMVETVIIPWPERGSSTVCISSQVGCRQGCTFCRTGRMGKLRDLTTDEILAQVLFSIKETATITDDTINEEDGKKLFSVDNIVFMGMGEPADNADAVVRAANILTDPHQFQLSPRKVTISTVAPTPESFHALGEANALLAWSVHASQDDLRRKLVPTTKYSMATLRDEGLKPALLKRSKKARAAMLEVALIDGINDDDIAADHLAEFCQPLLDSVPDIKLVVNLIPWNDIGAQSGPAAEYKQPSTEKVYAFQQRFLDTASKIEGEALHKRQLRCYVRTTRGDDESAACGQLATKKSNQQTAAE